MKMKDSDLLNYIKLALDYDPEQGILTYRISVPGKTYGDRAGSVNKGNGYRNIKIKDTLYQEARIIWLWCHGEWPVDQIDHINRNQADNRLSNLRDATPKENCANRSEIWCQA